MFFRSRRKRFLIFIIKLLTLSKLSESFKLPVPQVFIVTPAPKSIQIDEGRSAPYYYSSWRRHDASNNTRTSDTTTHQRVNKTPDLIFAEFESNKGSSDSNTKKSLKKLLENERIRTSISTTTTTTTVPTKILTDGKVLNSEPSDSALNTMFETKHNGIDSSLSMYSNLYNIPTSPSKEPSTFSTSPTALTETTPDTMQVQNIWHIIDNEQNYQGKWNEEPILASPLTTTAVPDNQILDGEQNTEKSGQPNESDFFYSGYHTDVPENESRAIRTDSNLKFPYVNLKTFQMMKPKKNINSISNKRENNILTSLDNFKELASPVRGEAQDMPQYSTYQKLKPYASDRYNPAQHYLPTQKNNNKSVYKPPVQATANLVPPPPPLQPPKESPGDVLPPPSVYDSFPPFPPTQTFTVTPKQSAPSNNPSTFYQSPDSDTDLDSGPNNEDDTKEHLAPLPMLSGGYLDSKLAPPTMETNDLKPGYYYDKPPVAYHGPYAPPDSEDTPPVLLDTDKPKHSHHFPKPPADDTSYHGYHYSKPSYHGFEDADYPELIFDKGHKNKVKVEDNMNDIGMKPPPPMIDDMKPDSPPLTDHDSDLKFHGYDDFFHDHHHDYHHHHHPPTTTTTTTTEMPRVNRFSYYYLGKKLYYLPLYFSVYFVVYVAALIVKAVLRHKIVYPNSWRPFTGPADGFNKRSVNDYNFDIKGEKLHEITRIVTNGLMKAADKYMSKSKIK